MPADETVLSFLDAYTPASLVAFVWAVAVVLAIAGARVRFSR